LTQLAEDRTAMAAAERQGAIGFTTEIGGGGTVTRTSLALAERGIRRLLHHAGLLRGDALPPEPEPTRVMAVRIPEHYVYASEDGLFEPLVELGDRVAAGQPAARIHLVADPLRPAVEIAFGAAGLVVCKRIPCLAERGDCLFHLAAELTDG
jgi:predicted deacylase